MFLFIAQIKAITAAVIMVAAMHHMAHMRHEEHIQFERSYYVVTTYMSNDSQHNSAGISSGRSDSESSFAGTLSCNGLEELWTSAGGNPADAFMAAEIAMAESGGNQYALSPTDDYGYWQINASHGPVMATFNAYGNARAAIEISSDGSNWGAWTTYTEGLYIGRCLGARSRIQRFGRRCLYGGGNAYG